jgi:glyoxylase-like metal-dependent hydrolase (beta-lactamase superfamily II)
MGGNVAVFIDEDSTLLVDTGSSADGVENIKSAISKVSDKPIRLVVNTHWHSDHIAGNEKMSELGATIIAHDNGKQRMLSDQYIEFLGMAVPKAPEKAIPQATFSKELKLKIDGDDIFIFQVQQGHTDTDAVVFFKSANVIHVGDLYFNGWYPYIGVSSGGSINDMIKVINTILPKLDDKTIVIPGHGAISNKAEFTTYVNMLTSVRDRIQAKIKEGKSLDEIIASKPTEEYDDPWGIPWLKGEDFVRLVHMDLIRTEPEADKSKQEE